MTQYLKVPQLNNFLQKDPVQKKEQQGILSKASGSYVDRGDQAPNVLTGTVITSCFIQTSALPSRIELEGNDITFFDDTYEKGGVVVGDTSRLIFTHGSGRRGVEVQEGFILEKRASSHDTYDNVLSWYALPPKSGRMNYFYLGLDGRFTNSNVNYIALCVNHSSSPVSQAIANGVFIVSGSLDGAVPPTGNLYVIHNSLIGITTEGFSVLLGGTNTGIIGVDSAILPFRSGLNLGTPTQKFGTFYGSVSACPLPTVDNALVVLDRIEEPTFVGERGHYGLDRKYFDDLTFPEELLYTDSEGHTDIEHNNMLGFLLKVVKELKAEVDLLKSKS